MTVELSTPTHITTLRDCAMQCNLEVRMWVGTVQDDQLSDEVTESKQAERGSAKVIKNLLASCHEHTLVKRYRSFAYNWFKQRSYPYVGSTGLVSNYGIPKIMNEFDNEIKPGYMATVNPFLLAYADLRANYAFKMQGNMYNASDYPEVDEIRDKFSINLYMQPIPSSDFSQRISADIAEQLNMHYSRQAERFIRETGERQLAQLAKVMQSISHCCEVDIKETATGETKVTRRRLHESTLERAIEYCDSFKYFNPSGDARLEGIRADLERVLQGVDIKTLRDSDSLRATVKSDVDDIMKRFGL
jgi:hypothetical protein